MSVADMLFKNLRLRGAKVRLIEVIDHDETHRYSICHIHSYFEMYMYELFYSKGNWYYRDSYKGPLKPVEGNLVDFICNERLKDDKK